MDPVNPKSDAAQPLLVRPVPPTTERIDTKKFLLVCAVLGGLLVLVFGFKLQRNFTANQGVPTAPLPGIHEVSGAGALDQLLTGPRSYAGIDRRPSPAPKHEPAAPPPMLTAPPSPPPLAAVPASQPVPTPPAPTAPPPPAAVVVPPPAPTAAPKPAPKRWLFAEMQRAGTTPPGATPSGVHERLSSAAGSGSSTTLGEPLMRPARQDTPLDPTRVLYRSQVISGLLLHEINSDIPGQVRMLVTQPVLDRFHHRQVLIPQASILLGVHEKTPHFGQQRLAVTIEEVHTPEGAIMALPGQLADRQGALGATGTVNHHLGAIGVAAVLSAALNVGARSLAGDSSGWQPSVPQEVARETGQSINRTAQSIVERTLTIPPTITLKAGTPVTIQLTQNLTLPFPPRGGR